MEFQFIFTPLVWTLLGLLLVSILCGATLGARHLRITARLHLRKTAGNETLPSGLSVIIYAHNAEDRIEELLRELLEQNHPDFQLIVVDDASDDNTARIVKRLADEDDRIYLTFVSNTAWYISRRKLAYTLGIRAAKHPVVLLTESCVIPPSREWFARMATPFVNPKTELVIGTSYTPAGTDKGTGKWWRSFDSLSSHARWVGAAAMGHAYRGTSMNLAFRPEIFLNDRSFGEYNHLQGGEDDIFVNQVSNASNTVLITDEKAMPGISLPAEEYPRLWRRAKERYTFTSQYLHTSALRTQGFYSLCNWVALLSTVAVWILGWPNLLAGVIATLIIMLYWGDQICVYRRMAKQLKSIRLWWSVPLFWLLRPLAGVIFRLSTLNKGVTHSSRYISY